MYSFLYVIALIFAVNILLILRLPIDAIWRVAIWTALGLLLYLLYGIHYSHLNSEYIILKKEKEQPSITSLLTGDTQTYGSQSSEKDESDE